jgi:hypothetical protein
MPPSKHGRPPVLNAIAEMASDLIELTQARKPSRKQLR